MVERVCDELDVSHSTLTVDWDRKPETAIQERARTERYRLLGRWAAERSLTAIATAHHLDDQAETLLVRLNRGAGVRGLAGMRSDAPLPGGEATVRLIRPLLDWRHSELLSICDAAGVAPADDPSNHDEQFERVRIRKALAEAQWLHAKALVKSAANLASADDSLRWATDLEWERQIERSAEAITYSPKAPLEIRLRIVRRSVAAFANEGVENPLRGRELDRLVEALSSGSKMTIRGVLCSGGEKWCFRIAPRRGSSQD